jgi:hypothetical protein
MEMLSGVALSSTRGMTLGGSCFLMSSLAFLCCFFGPNIATGCPTATLLNAAIARRESKTRTRGFRERTGTLMVILIPESTSA